jgi:transcriptional regulator with XRE-family HTH domain
MEFKEKLQELRKARSLTQEELAEALFVSRTAISKWESGRGYPSLDSLKEISRYFSVSIDDLISTEEIISAAADEKKEFMDKYISLICNMLDIFMALLLILPVFGNGADNPSSVSLYAITGLSPWIKTAFAVLIGLTVLNGICGVVISRFDKPVWNRHRLVTGMVLTIAGAALFILTRQPYAGAICLVILVVKGWLIGKGKSLL